MRAGRRPGPGGLLHRIVRASLDPTDDALSGETTDVHEPFRLAVNPTALTTQ
jgi:hypothetical protein